MTTPGNKKDIISQLKKDILLWEGFVPPSVGVAKGIGLGSLEAAFPNGVFPTGAIHEMLCPTREQQAATSGLLGGVLAALMQKGGPCLWVSKDRRLFPPAIAAFNVEPHRIIFIDAANEKEVLWCMEEALKCSGVAAVIAEVREISFAESRRLQLAVESSRVTGFLLRNDLRKLNTTTCVARWQVTPLPGVLEDGMPGVGYPRWQVDLLRVRNGSTGSWVLEWGPDGFVQIENTAETHLTETRQVG